MGVIIQTGLKSTESEQLISLLYQRGLSKPLPSYSYNLTADELAKKLDQIIANTSFEDSKSFIENVMIDFLLGNLDVDALGWESEANLPALQYWLKIDDRTKFVLVFDHPKTILKNIPLTEWDQESLNQQIENWCTYNQKLLDFYEENKARCILVEGIAAKTSIVKFKEIVQELDSDIELKSGWQTAGFYADSKSNMSENINKKYEQLLNPLSDELIVNYPDSIILFNKLLSEADLKASETVFKTKRTSLNKLILALNSIGELKSSESGIKWYKERLDTIEYERNKVEEQNAELKKKQELITKELDDKINKLVNEKTLLKTENSKLNSSIEQLDKQIAQKSKELIASENKLENEKNKIDSKIKSIEEKYKSDKNKIESENSSLKSKLKSLEISSQKEVTRLEKEISNLQLQLNDLATSSKLSDEQLNNQLLSQLLDLQEQLEVLHKTTSINHDQYSISDAASDKQHLKTKQYSAVDAIKSDLPYRLGNRIVKAKTTRDIAQLPLTLVKEYKAFEKGKQLQEMYVPSQDYSDKEEVEKVKSHLSYQLGKAIVDSKDSPKKIVSLPLTIGKTVLKFKKSK